MWPGHGDNDDMLPQGVKIKIASESSAVKPTQNE